MMNAKKANTAQPAALKAYAITPQLQGAIKNVELLLAKRKSIDEKISSGMADAKAAEVPYEQALNVQAEAEANLALATKTHEHVEREKLVDTADQAVEAAQRNKTRLHRTVQALCRMAVETDQEIEVARVAVDVEIGLLIGDLTVAFAADVSEAIKPLVEVIARGQALANATHSRLLRDFVNGLVIPNPQDATGFYPLIGGGNITVDGETINIGSIDTVEPTAVAIRHEFLSVSAIRMKLLAHRPFVHPDQRPKPYVLKGETLAFRRQESPHVSAPSHEILFR